MSQPQRKLLQEAETILADAQTPPPRLILEVHIKDALRSAYPYSVSATEIGERLGITTAHKILGYLTLFGEVDKTGFGRYRHKEDADE